MANIGQTIIIRTDLFDLPQDMGLLAAQVAHIHFEMTRKILNKNYIAKEQFIGIELPNEVVETEAFIEWMNQPYLFVKRVPNAEGLRHFWKLAQEAKLPTAEWRDTVYVRFSSTMKQAFKDTLVGISIGPADSDRIRTVVGDLPLL